MGEHLPSCRNSIIRHLQPHRSFPLSISIDHRSLRSINHSRASAHSLPSGSPTFIGHSIHRLVLADFHLIVADSIPGSIYSQPSHVLHLFLGQQFVVLNLHHSSSIRDNFTVKTTPHAVRTLSLGEHLAILPIPRDHSTLAPMSTSPSLSLLDSSMS